MRMMTVLDACNRFTGMFFPDIYNDDFSLSFDRLLFHHWTAFVCGVVLDMLGWYGSGLSDGNMRVRPSHVRRKHDHMH